MILMYHYLKIRMEYFLLYLVLSSIKHGSHYKDMIYFLHNSSGTYLYSSLNQMPDILAKPFDQSPCVHLTNQKE